MNHDNDDKLDENTQKPDLSQIPPLRPVEELEQDAYPGMTPRERRLEQRTNDGFTYADEEAEDVRERDIIIGAAVMPAESTMVSAPAGSGAAPGPVIVTTLDEDELDDKIDERKLR